MQTSFTLAQLADPNIAESEKILRACVHCGFCTATCPTYVLLGDELDSPRGRIYLIKDMLEQGRPATREVVKHIDRCLSCLACMTTCPSGVHYMHLVDHARAYIEQTYRRPLIDRLLRAVLARVMPDPKLFRLSLLPARLAKPLAPLFESFGFAQIAAMLRLAPDASAPAPSSQRQVFPAEGRLCGRVALLRGCVNDVLAPQINAAAIRVLTRHGVEVVLAGGEGCCGGLTHHMGKETDALARARNNIDAWAKEFEGDGLDAILVTASGCGTTIKDYGFMLRTDPRYAGKAANVASLARDVSEYLATLDLDPPVRSPGLTVAYHPPCSLQHGQKITREPKALLAKAGFTVREFAEAHICCGSAGTYNLLQPAIARRLAARKAANIERARPDVIASSNLGCMIQIGEETGIPVVHLVELLDWATGGPVPERLRAIDTAVQMLGANEPAA
jgi:glycolate oxidase iron-sulfur subunit